MIERPGIDPDVTQQPAKQTTAATVIEQSGLTHTQESQDEPYDGATCQAAANRSDIADSQRRRVRFGKPVRFIGLQAAAVATTPVADLVALQNGQIELFLDQTVT